jgi:putative FmdB family regulatory protein
MGSLIPPWGWRAARFFYNYRFSRGQAMPIYAYRCSSCGHAKDVLQKISDPVLTTCPACGAESFQKQITAAGFQLKGSGWYATDFRGGSGGTSAPATGAAAAAAAAPESSTASGGDTGGTPCGGSCACH